MNVMESWICTHCGRKSSGYRESAIGYGDTPPAPLCHPQDASLPDCYRRVLIHKEPLGSLVELSTLPAGVVDIVDPDSFSQDWERIRDRYESLGGAADPIVNLIRAAFEQWQRCFRLVALEEQNGKRPKLTLLAEMNTWHYRVLRMLDSREGRTEVQDRVAEDLDWW